MAPSSKSTEVEILDSLSSSIARLETDLHNLNNHSPTIDNSLWTEEADKKAIDDLRRKASRYKSEHSTKIDRIKQTVREEYPQIITRELRLVKAVHIKSNMFGLTFVFFSSEIQELIRKEIQANVNSHFKTQIKDILPVSLQQQLEETNAQLETGKGRTY
ncbi:hypothetical protein BT96DRAFT_670706 [Gymnopus androsaceus JB14]|uniref:Uncharacterized protein n=1 Tax=Gymnopus androsaceus JB14 TaxID=1447944 RepID=A0A6A4IJN5_9AGAR|nr:hypothetical protein BT96DRAFT_670706 [Gymnopus androsaceus JB14]